MTERLKENKYTIFLMVILIFAPWFSYRYALSRYFALNKTVKEQQSEISALRHKHATVSDKSMESTDLIFTGNIIDRINPIIIENNLTIIHFIPYITQSEKTSALHTADLTVSGDYLKMILLIDHIEKNYKQCRIISTDYTLQGMGYRRKKELHCTIVIQQIVKSTSL